MVEPPPSYPDAAAALRPPGLRSGLLGALRVAASAALIAGACPAVLLAAVVPDRRNGPPAALRVARWTCRAFLWLNAIRFRVDDPEAVRQLRGFAFFNHVSYLDVPAVLALHPVRFLATAGVRRLPFIGWMARAAGTVFVQRSNGASREAARDDLLAAYRRRPLPIALAPEGGVHPGPSVAPFRHGAFEVAADAEAPVTLLALEYQPRGYVAWRGGENLVRAYWRLAARTEPITAHVLVRRPELRGLPASEAAAVSEHAVNDALASVWAARPPRRVR